MIKDDRNSNDCRPYNSNSFEYWHAQYNKSARSVIGFRLSPLFKMLKFANTFEQLCIVHDEARRCKQSKEQHEALKRMAKRATTFDHWCVIVDRVDAGSKLEKLAMRKLVDLAKSLEQWYAIYRMSNPHGTTKRLLRFKLEYQALALQRIANITAKFDEWNLVYRSAILARDDTIINIALSNMSKR